MSSERFRLRNRRSACYRGFNQPGEDQLAPDRKTIVHKKFRLHDKLLREIERAAKGNDCSVNEEIERRLQESFVYDKWRKESEDRQKEQEIWREERREERERWALVFRTLKSAGNLPPQFEQIAEELDIKTEDGIFNDAVSGLGKKD